MARQHRSHSIAFKRQVVSEHHDGEALGVWSRNEVVRVDFED